MSFIVKNTTFPNLLDLLAPHSCRGCGRLGNVLCDCCKNNIVKNTKNYCPNCKKENPTGNCKNCKDLPPTFVVGIRDEIIGNLISDFKFHSVHALALPLAKILNEILPNLNEMVSIVPLPTINQHIRKRGLDHTLLIAKKLAKLRGKNYRIEKVLIRNNNSVQVGSNAKIREEQAIKAYTIKPKTKINPDKTYLLLDDVWTTGASMKAALKKLREAGAKKIVIVLLAVNRLD